VPEILARASYPEHIVQLTQLYTDVLVLQVLGQEQPILIKGTHKAILGRFSPGEVAPTVDLNPFNAALMGVSRHHATITRKEQSYALQDLGSTNGTWLNEVKLIPNQGYDLRNGDLIRLGQLAFYVYFRVRDPNEPLEETLYLKVDDTSYKLTPHDLETRLAPYLNAVAGLQTICNEIAGRDKPEVYITGVHTSPQSAFITVKMIGARDALSMARGAVKTWRESHAEQISLYRQKHGTGRWEALDAAPELEPIAVQVAETGENGTDQLQRAEVRLATDLLADFSPEKSEADRQPFTGRLLEHLHILASSIFQIAVPEKPTTGS
jgi:hypothetical protein